MHILIGHKSFTDVQKVSTPIYISVCVAINLSISDTLSFSLFLSLEFSPLLICSQQHQTPAILFIKVVKLAASQAASLISNYTPFFFL